MVMVKVVDDTLFNKNKFVFPYHIRKKKKKTYMTFSIQSMEIYLDLLLLHMTHYLHLVDAQVDLIL